MKKMKKSVSRIIRIDENLDTMIRYRLSWLAQNGNKTTFSDWLRSLIEYELLGLRKRGDANIH